MGSFICIGVSLSLRVSAGNGIGFICMGVSLSLRSLRLLMAAVEMVFPYPRNVLLINPSTSVLRKSRR